METSSFGYIEEEERNSPYSFSSIQELQTNGATSDTYKVLIHGKWHFLKRPKAEHKDNPFYLSAFQKEFEIGYSLNHPNIVRYITKGSDKDGFYFLTEYIDGVPLSEFLAKHPNYFSDKKNLTKFINQLFSAIKYIHERQILHLDLKPENILITAIGYDVKIVDFGFSYSDCFQSTIGKTTIYAAPEQLSPNETVDIQTDIYAIGGILKFILANRIGSPYKTLIKRCQEPAKKKRFKNIDEVELSLKQQRKKNRLWSVFIPIFLFLTTAFILLGYLNRETSSLEHLPVQQQEEKSIAIPETPLEKTHTLEQEKPSHLENNSIQQIEKTEVMKQEEENRSDPEQSVLSPTEKLNLDIQELLKKNFARLYSNYDEINSENYDEISSVYQNSVNTSLSMADSLNLIYTDIDKNDISKMLYIKSIEEASIYLMWMQQYDAKQRKSVDVEVLSNEK
ncbi:serine/threonine protein kinase [Parabacteroides sp. PFB2-12]|uniref:protein kinase domain-containing protein n=1 Tax=unclassified Parabacteroides TaxID=2649774 RepID=UPI002473FE22|nr:MULTISPECIES: protein kinase [unclassified Parabacteroides]MDH6343431.1 serine/threonine protein kinase [Parabacteroides sp. PM6-13]MDH6391977.1 serine/threonine protein kinase [Parabacteroides sp. PFB2-12]